eukprot:1156225-Pelagomonas_calceolata.AAC.1
MQLDLASLVFLLFCFPSILFFSLLLGGMSRRLTVWPDHFGAKEARQVGILATSALVVTLPGLP